MVMLEHCPSIAWVALPRAFRFSNARTYARYSQRTTHLALLSHLTFRAQGVERFSVGEGGIRNNFAPLVGRREAGMRAALRVGEAESA